MKQAARKSPGSHPDQGLLVPEAEHHICAHGQRGCPLGFDPGRNGQQPSPLRKSASELVLPDLVGEVALHHLVVGQESANEPIQPRSGQRPDFLEQVPAHQVDGLGHHPRGVVLAEEKGQFFYSGRHEGHGLLHMLVGPDVWPHRDGGFAGALANRPALGGRVGLALGCGFWHGDGVDDVVVHAGLLW